MKLVDIGLSHFDDDAQQEVFVKVLNDDGTTVNRRLSDLLDLNSQAATDKALHDIGAKRLK